MTSMPKQAPVADRVSNETIQKLDFLTGQSLGELRGVSVRIELPGQQVVLKVDKNGNVSEVRGQPLAQLCAPGV